MTLVPAVSDLKVDLTPLGPPVEMVTLIACISPQVVPVRGGLGYPWAALSYPVAAARCGCRPRDTWSGAEQLGWSVLLSPGESRASRCLLAGSEGPVVPGETPGNPVLP